MSTRAVYTFIGEDKETHHVYKHHDGYPSGAADAIANALPYAWPLPRFEPDEFGAAFVAGNKSQGGGVRLTRHWDNHGDLKYRYEISLRNSRLRIVAYSATYGVAPDYKVTWEKIYAGDLAGFAEFAKRAAA
jgi:hypothetical protein